MTETAYLSLLGERVRAWRSEQGVTRKALALASGVSERYLAQLEAGEGNISVLLLRKVARAMGVPVENLVREVAPREKPIALLGLRGAGKSTLGAKLAEALKLPFIGSIAKSRRKPAPSLAKCSRCTGRMRIADSNDARSSVCWRMMSGP